MTGSFADTSDILDRKTTRSICNAVGERLAQSIRPEPRLSSQLQELVDEMGKRERDGRSRY
jgi:hypothetical protein